MADWSRIEENGSVSAKVRYIYIYFILFIFIYISVRGTNLHNTCTYESINRFCCLMNGFKKISNKGLPLGGGRSLCSLK